LATILLYYHYYLVEKERAQKFIKLGVKEVERTFEKMIPMGDEYFYTDGSNIMYLADKKVFDKVK